MNLHGFKPFNKLIYVTLFYIAQLKFTVCELGTLIKSCYNNLMRWLNKLNLKQCFKIMHITCI
jgi:hypothetical protein